MTNRAETPVELTLVGARYGVGRDADGFGIWALDRPVGPPLERFTFTPDGWSAANARWRGLEEGAPLARRSHAPHELAAGGLFAALVLGIVGLFPNYLGGTSLAADGSELASHLPYLIVDALVLAIFVTVPRWRDTAAMFGLGTSIVAAGLFLADLATSAGQQPGGLGLALSTISLVLAGFACALLLRAPLRARRLGGPGPLRGAVAGLGALVALGTAVTFAPSWNRYVVYVASLHETRTLLLGNAFSNPALIAAADVVTMLLFAVVPLVALTWVPARYGAPLLAGAAVPLVAQVIGAVFQIHEAVSPSTFGFSLAEAREAGLQVSSGLSGAFYGFAGLATLLVIIAGVLASEERGRITG